MLAVVNHPPDGVTSRARARVGAVLRGKWRLDALLGIGGMAAVYSATHRNGKRGAVKLLHLSLSTDAESRQRFLREGYVANAVGHPGAVSVLDDDVADDGAVFLVMELLEGQPVDLRAAAREGSKLLPGEVLAIADQLLETLVAAHQKGIVHRDLKPENLFVTKEGRVKVLDFGLARLHDMGHGSKAGRMTGTGSAMGTPAFMPPEQALGNWDAVDARTDLWAVGATMFNLLTGRFVHDADTVNKLLLAAMTKPAPKVASLDPSVPAPVAAIVDRALAFESKDRWPDAAAMLDAVRRARATIRGEVARGAGGGEPPSVPHDASRKLVASSQTPIRPTPSGPKITIGRRGIVAGAVAAVILCAITIVLLVGGGGPRPVVQPPHPEPSMTATAAPTPAPLAGSAAPSLPTDSATPSLTSTSSAPAPSVTPAPSHEAIAPTVTPPTPTTGSHRGPTKGAATAPTRVEKPPADPLDKY
jgi:serine/threonine-protein kinase